MVFWHQIKGLLPTRDGEVVKEIQKPPQKSLFGRQATPHMSSKDCNYPSRADVCYTCIINYF
jgi:hypothetical protein